MRVNANNILNHNATLVNIIDKDIPMPYPLRSAIINNYKVFNAEIDIIKKSVLDINSMDISDDEKHTKLIELGNSEVELNIVTVNRDLLRVDGLSVKDELLLDFMLTDGEEG